MPEYRGLRMFGRYYPALDALDAFQLTKALYALALVLTYIFGLPEASVTSVANVLAYVLAIRPGFWIALLASYVTASGACLFWKNDKFQALISFLSLWLWTFNGVITLLAGNSAAAGIFQVCLGAISIVALYHRGRIAE